MKLILLNGPAGVGKSTIARRYIDEHPLSMSIEGDQIIGMIGAWRQNELEARKLKLAQIQGMVELALSAGNNVILPYLVTDATHVEIFEKIAERHNANFYEVILAVEKEDAVARLLERGRWGEEGSKQLTEEDTPRIEGLYDLMMLELRKRPNVVSIQAMKGDIDTTYSDFLDAVSS